MRNGVKIYKNKEVPINCKIFTNNLGQEFYVCGVKNTNGYWQYTVYILDTEKYLDLEAKKIENYLCN